MKKLLLLLTFISPVFVNAQTYVYHPFPTTEGCWSYQYYDDFHNPTGLFNGYSLNGDTTIASVNYKKIQGGAIRESSKIIYFRPDTSSSEFILYNFNLNTGDTIIHPYGGAVCSNDTVTIDWVDTVLLSDRYHRQFYLSSQSIWIEGIGSMFYLLQPCNVLCVSGNDILECMHGDSGAVFMGATCQGCLPVSVKEQNMLPDIAISPNPFTSQTTISFGEPQKNTIIKITDTFGKEIKSIIFTGRQLVIEKENLKAGIYFVQTIDEKKIISNRKIIIQ